MDQIKEVYQFIIDNQGALLGLLLALSEVLALTKLKSNSILQMIIPYLKKNK